MLDTHGPNAKPDKLTGEYWTDRDTKGTMVFTRRKDQVYSRFEDADEAFRS